MNKVIEWIRNLCDTPTVRRVFYTYFEYTKHPPLLVADIYWTAWTTLAVFVVIYTIPQTVVPPWMVLTFWVMLGLFVFGEVIAIILKTTNKYGDLATTYWEWLWAHINDYLLRIIWSFILMIVVAIYWSLIVALIGSIWIIIHFVLHGE